MYLRRPQNLSSKRSKLAGQPKEQALKPVFSQLFLQVVDLCACEESSQTTWHRCSKTAGTQNPNKWRKKVEGKRKTQFNSNTRTWPRNSKKRLLYFSSTRPGSLPSYIDEGLHKQRNSTLISGFFSRL